MRLKRIAQPHVAVTTPQETVVEAARRMRALHVGDLVVVEERDDRRWPVGIVTDRDIVVAVIADATAHLPTLRVGDIMATPVVTVFEDDDLTDALRTMRRMGVRRLPVRAADGSLAGIVTLDDIIDFLSATLREATSIVSRQQAIERVTRKSRVSRPGVGRAENALAVPAAS